MMKFILRSIVLTGLLFLNSANTRCNPTDLIKLSRNAVFVPERLGALDLLHDDNGFKVEKNGEIHTIQNCFVEKEIRGISKDKLARLLVAGAYLSLNGIDDGNDYSLRLNGRLNGGGVGGATAGAIAGKFAVHFVGHGLIYIAALCTGPAFPVTVVSLEAALLPTIIEPLSNVAAVGCGIAGGVVTGPV